MSTEPLGLHAPEPTGRPGHVTDCSDLRKLTMTVMTLLPAAGVQAAEVGGQVLTRIWLGDKPVQTDLKQALWEA